MSGQPPGRHTGSLFDNRYRYDHIFPRGRSGETLRAYDTQDGDRPVVIKRPAPQDAPPMRAGQEVSIRTEKRALQRLAGHPVLAELRGSGAFRVGGQTHEYIVMDLARGEIVEKMVLALAEQNEYLPELEMLVIIDRLLDLLVHAHDQQVIYNDVDAKHLFWNRQTYQLKVIDWGNAVFLDEPGALPNVNRATDIYQVGELLYFILSGGNRLAVEVEDNDTFFVNFGPDSQRISARLQTILTRTVHPDPKRRYGTISELRQTLAEYRQPLEKARDDVIAQVRRRVRPTASQEELEDLYETLDTALVMDPGYPAAASLAAEIEGHLHHIRTQADLDAIRIYIESEHWSRAFSLLQDLLPQADERNEPLIRFLISAAAILEDQHVTPPPAGFLIALDDLFQENATAAGQALLSTDETRTSAQHIQWLLAEQLTFHMPHVMLLRPHLFRLRERLNRLEGADAALDWLDEVDTELARTPGPGLDGLRIRYREAATLLNQLESVIETLDDVEDNLASVIRAQRAAAEIVARLGEVGQYVYSDPDHAADLLKRAAMIDPTSSHFATLHDYFDEVHQAIAALSQFKPASSGANLSTWFADVQTFIEPYLNDLPDQRLHAIASAIHQAAEGWTTIVSYLALGRRRPTIQVARNTADIVRSYNEHIAAWLGTIANRLPDAEHAEYLSPNGALAELLVDGWKAWDRGDTTHAMQLSEQARQRAVTDGERLAADRLQKMGALLENWLADGTHDVQRTDQAELQVLSILLSDEEQERRTFAEQMPNTATYLRAMERGIVTYMHQSSSAGWRALFVHYALRGMLALFDNNLEEAEFWRNVAQRSWEESRTHRIFQVFDRTLTSRHLIDEAENALNAVTRPQDLNTARQALNAPLAGEVLAGAEESVQLALDALSSWSDGDFYAARQALDLALEHIQQTIEISDLQVENYVTWLTHLRDAAAELHQLRLTIEQGANTTREEPDPALEEAHARIVTLTLQTLGSDYTHQVRQWEDTYRAVFDTYTAPDLDHHTKLSAFSRHFVSLFITRHPAYPLFRHWESVINQQLTAEKEHDLAESDDIDDDEIDNEIEYDYAHDDDLGDKLAYLEDDRDIRPQVLPEPGRSDDLPWNTIIAVALVLLIVGGSIAVLRALNQDKETGDTLPVNAATTSAPSVASSITASPTLPETQVVVQPTQPVIVVPTVTATEEPTSTPVPTFELPTIPPTVPTETPTATSQPTLIPTETPTTTVTMGPPTVTETPFVTATFVPTDTPDPVAVAASGGGANHSALAALAKLPDALAPGPDGAILILDDGTWVLSTGTQDSISLVFPPELLNAMFIPGAASTFRRADITLELAQIDPAVLDSGAVAVGLGAENTDEQQTIGQVQFVQSNFVSVGLNQNGRFRSSTEYPQQTTEIVLSVRRINANTLSYFVDEKWLGDSVFLFAQGEPITLIVYVTGRNVTITVNTFEVDFSPRDEIP